MWNIERRLLWRICYIFFSRCFPTNLFLSWRLFVLRVFGAKIANSANVYSSAFVESPWNLIMKDYSCLGPHVRIENDALVSIGVRSTISQYSYVCTSSHNIDSPIHELVTNPIIIKDNMWVAAASFVGKGVTIGEGAVVGARAAVFRDVMPWTVVGGNPAKCLKIRMGGINKENKVLSLAFANNIKATKAA